MLTFIKNKVFNYLFKNIDLLDIPILYTVYIIYKEFELNIVFMSGMSLK